MIGKHQSRRVVAACMENVWAIDPRKLEEIADLLELRAGGGEVSEEQIKAISVINSGPLEEDDEPEVVDGVQVLRLFGTMAPRMNLLTRFSGGTSTQLLGNQLIKARNNSEIKTVVIEVDSPGGVVTGTEELRQIIFSMREEKRVVAIARGPAASAAYYVASAATSFVATPSSEIGSIGVYAIVSEQTKAAEKVGITYHVFRAGALKASGNPFEPLSAERAAALQARIDAPYRQFVKSVAENRNVSEETVLSQFGQGTTFLAEEALRRGMIDGVRMFEEVVSQEREAGRAGSTASRVVTVVKESAMEISAKVKAALYAVGLIDEQDADEAECNSVIKGYFKGKVPSEEKKLLAGIADSLRESKQQLLGGGSSSIEWKELPVATLTTPAKQTEEQIIQGERQRFADIMARGEQLDVPDDDIRKACESNMKIDDIVSGWLDDHAAKKKKVVADIRQQGSESDKLATAAESTLMNRMGFETEMPPEARDMRYMRTVDIGKLFLRESGVRASADPEESALQWLQLGGNEVQMLAADGSWNRPGDHPHLLSVLAGKILDTSLKLANVTYKEWTARMADSPDLKPRTIVGIGSFEELDLLQDDEDFKDLPLTSELMQWIQVERYGNKVGLTPVMIANDDLDAFSEGLKELAFAHENKLNRLCVGVIKDNPTLPDGTALFHADHGNLQTGGDVGAPSDATASAMRTSHRRQTGIGGIGFVRAAPRIALVPPNQERASIQTFDSVLIGESKSAATDANINTVRGTMRTILENELHDALPFEWYTIANPSERRTIVHTFHRGYGSGGRRSTYMSNESKTRYWDLEGRFAVVAASHRGIVSNPATS